MVPNFANTLNSSLIILIDQSVGRTWLSFRSFISKFPLKSFLSLFLIFLKNILKYSLARDLILHIKVQISHKSIIIFFLEVNPIIFHQVLNLRRNLPSIYDASFENLFDRIFFYLGVLCIMDGYLDFGENLFKL